MRAASIGKVLAPMFRCVTLPSARAVPSALLLAGVTGAFGAGLYAQQDERRTCRIGRVERDTGCVRKSSGIAGRNTPSFFAAVAGLSICSFFGFGCWRLSSRGASVMHPSVVMMGCSRLSPPSPRVA